MAGRPADASMCSVDRSTGGLWAASSGFVILRPPRAPDRLRSVFIVGVAPHVAGDRHNPDDAKGTCRKLRYCESEKHRASPMVARDSRRNYLWCSEISRGLR